MLIPKDWTEVTVDRFVALKAVSVEDYEDSHEYQRDRCIALSGLSEQELREVDMDELTEFMLGTVWSYKNPVNKYDTTVGDYSFRGFDEMSLGEYIDLTVYFEDNYFENLPKILAVLYRRTGVGSWGQMVVEPYREVNIEQRAEEFGGMPISRFYGIISDFIRFREDFMMDRPALFGLDEDGNPEDEGVELEPRTPEEAEQNRMKEMLKKWGWEKMLYDLCKGDLTKLEGVTEMNLFMVFNFASMKHELKLD